MSSSVVPPAHEPEGMRDLVAIALLPAMWLGAEPLRIAESLAAALYTILTPCFVYIAFSERNGGALIEVLQTDRHETDSTLAHSAGPELRAWALSRDPDEVLQYQNPLGPGTLGVHTRRLGLHGDLGVMAVAFHEGSDERPYQNLLLNVSASQAALAINNARLLAAVRENEERVRAANTDLATANRRKDEFLAMLAHELRNPLAAISNGVQLCRKPDDFGRITRVAEIMGRQVDNLTKLIDDLLDVSRVTLGKINLARCEFDLADIVRQAIGSIQVPLRSKQHRLSVRVAETALPMNGDPLRIEQVLVNLLLNAIKYTDAGGTIGISACADGDQLVVTVADNGIGIAEDMLGNIFELFTQADTSFDRSQGGLGIGLTLAQSLVALHGGTISATSEGPGRGSEFTVRFPACHAPARPGAARNSAPSGTAEKVLVIGAEDDFTRALEEVFDSHGYVVKTPKAGPADFTPHIAVLDLEAPDSAQGTCLAHRLRAMRNHGVAIIALSGRNQEVALEALPPPGFDFHFVKPVDFPTLLGVTRHLLATS